MKKTTRLRALIAAKELLVMPGAYDALSAKMIERAGFAALQCTGFGIAASYLGLPDYSILSMNEMAERTAVIARSVDIPVMADADTGFGNAVNVWLTVRAFERAGAAGVNIEDQVMPKRCGHLDGKEVVPVEEMVGKIAAAVDARIDTDFVLNIRTDALATHGLDETIRRGNAYLEAGADMIFVDGVDAVDTIGSLVRGIAGPVSVNLVEGGKSPRGVTFDDLQRLGVARVSLPGTVTFGALRGMERALDAVKATRGSVDDRDVVFPFSEARRLAGMDHALGLERRFLSADALQKKYGEREI